MLLSYLNNPLADEFCRSSLFGVNGKSRRDLSELTPLLKSSLGVQFDDFMKEFEDEKSEILKVAKEAEAFAKKGGLRSSCEYEEIILKVSEKMGNYGRQYVNTVFQNAQKAPGGSNPKPAKAGKSLQTIPNEEFFRKKKSTSPLQKKLDKYQEVGLWDEGESKRSMMRSLIAEMRQICSDEQKIQAEIDKADAWIKEATPLMREAIKRNSDTPEQLAALQKCGDILINVITRYRQKNTNT